MSRSTPQTPEYRASCDRISALVLAIFDADPMRLAGATVREVEREGRAAEAAQRWSLVLERWRQAEHGLSRLLGTDAHLGIIDPAKEARRAVYRAAVRVAEGWSS